MIVKVVIIDHYPFFFYSAEHVGKKLLTVLLPVESSKRLNRVCIFPD